MQEEFLEDSHSPEKTNKRCYNDAIKLLSRRDYSQYKMSQKLKEKGHCLETIEVTIEKLIDQNYLREDEYKRIRIKTLLVKGHSDYYIKQKCEQEHLQITDEDIEQIKEKYEFSNEQIIQDLVQKKIRGIQIPNNFEEKLKIKNRIFRFLISKGHRYDEFKSIVEQFI